MAAWDAALESGFEMTAAATPGSWDAGALGGPFQLGRVQYALSAPLLQLCAARNKLVLCLAESTLRLVYIDLDDPTQTCEASVPPSTLRRANCAPDVRLFMDPSAQHVLLNTGENNYYWTPSWTRVRPLARLNGVCVTAAAWSAHVQVPAPAPLPPGRHWAMTTVLLGTARGDLLETTLAAHVSDTPGEIVDRFARKSAEFSLERGVHRLFTLSDAQPLAGLALMEDESAAAQQVAVIAATPSRLYEFTGPRGTGDLAWEPVFQPYRSALLPHLKTELPGDGPSSLVTAAMPRDTHASMPASSEARALEGRGADGGPRRQLTWQAPGGLYTAELTPTAPLEYTDFVPIADTPLAVARTLWHHVLVYTHRVVCLHTLDAHVVWEESLPLARGEHVVGIAMDPANDMCWIYTNLGMWELIVEREDRDVWRLLLARGEHERALAYCADEASRAEVLAAQGEARLAAGDACGAADCFAAAEGRPPLAQVTLALANEPAALRRYVAQRLERMPRTEHVPRLLLATWLVELHLAALTTTDKVDESLVRLLRSERATLDAPTTYALLARHGRLDMWLTFAEACGDTSRVVERLVREERWDMALDALSAQASPELYYTWAGPLMRHAPAATVTHWERVSLDVGRLVPALLQYVPKPGEPDHVLRYLAHVIDVQGCTDPAAYNLRVTRLAEAAVHNASAAQALQHFIESAGSALDATFALRVCARHGLQDASVRLYARMGQYENAVHRALEANDVDLACACADLVVNDATLRKDLWLVCARHVVQTEQSIQGAMAFLLRTDMLTIEDLLPLFPDFSVIDEFKTEICDTLESYVTRIDALKDEMDRMTLTTEHIQEDLQQLSQRTLPIDSEQPCMQCGLPLLQRQLYLFPCRHGFHADCLTDEVTRHLSPRRLRRLLQLQAKLATLHPHDTPEEQASARAASAAADEAAAAAEPSGTAPTGLAALSSSLMLDRLSEHVRPQAIVDAITSGLSAGVASGRRVLAPLDPFVEPARRTISSQLPSSTLTPDQLAAADAARHEMNSIVAGACPACALSVQQIAKPFETGDSEWIV